MRENVQYRSASVAIVGVNLMIVTRVNYSSPNDGNEQKIFVAFQLSTWQRDCTIIARKESIQRARIPPAVVMHVLLSN